ncbi:hypothetical protein FOA52_009867 [Chlamydomonas sp. UWO 241]|nr:hypothetical protein FOA52_009867 [Chlamydomonas sp. UWO 241]
MAGFDPRRHSTLVLSVKERHTLYTSANGSTKGKDSNVKSYLVGPNKPDSIGVNSLHRPATAPLPSQYNKVNSDAHPGFLNPNGKWTQDALPYLIAESQAQALTATGTLTATMPGKHGAGQPLRPLTTVYTYNDISPVATAQYVNDGEASDPVATLRAPPKVMDVSRPDGGGQSECLDWTAKSTIGSADARIESVASFWNKLNGAYNLKISDVTRTELIGKNVVPGTPNTRLIGGKWRYLQRPVEGDTVYTDYYGRCGEDSCNYYGRKYNVDTEAFAQSPLVDEGDYIKVGASMAGVHALRTRPGLSLDATVASGPSAVLERLSPYTLASTRGVHKFPTHARLKATAARPEWA